MTESFLSDSPYYYTRSSYISRPSPVEIRTSTYTRPSHVYSSSAYYPSHSRYYDYAYDYVGRPVTSVSTTYQTTSPYYYNRYSYPVSYANAATYGPTYTYETYSPRYTRTAPYEVKKEVTYSPRLSAASTLASPLRSSTVIETTYNTQSPLRRSYVHRSLYPTTASPLWSEYKYGRPWRYYSYPRYQNYVYSRPYTSSSTYTYESPTHSRYVPSYVEYNRPTIVERTSVTYRDNLPRDTYDPLTGTSRYVTKDYLADKTIETTVSPTRTETKVYNSADIGSRYDSVVRRTYVY